MKTEHRAAIFSAEMRLRNTVAQLKADLGVEAASPIVDHILAAIQACDTMRGQTAVEEEVERV